jgi:tetratricopeptide (TPR) repeat protein
MQFDSTNQINRLCAEAICLEAEGKKEEALLLFLKAWDEAGNDFEKLVSAHYVARQQKNTEEKLEWDWKALSFAFKINDENARACYPSLYLNIARCYEDLNNFENALKNYQLAASYTGFLAEDGYSTMIKRGIANGLERMRKEK